MASHSLDAWQKEREAKDRRHELAKALERAENNHRDLEHNRDKHDQAQHDLDALYHSIFSGPTPEMPGEDHLEEDVREKRDRFEQCQTAVGTERHAYEALTRAHTTLQAAAADMADARDMSRVDLWGGGTFTDLMERDALSKAQNGVTQALRHMDEARRAQPAISALTNISIDQGHFISDVMFDSIFTDLAQHDRIRASQTQVDEAVRQLGRELVPAQAGRVTEARARLQEAGGLLEGARKELQRVRAEAFERVEAGGGGGGGGAGDEPPAYTG